MKTGILEVVSGLKGHYMYTVHLPLKTGARRVFIRYKGSKGQRDTIDCYLLAELDVNIDSEVIRLHL